MKKHITNRFFLSLTLAFLLFSCTESKQEKEERLEREKIERIETKRRLEKERLEREKQEEIERIETKRRLEKERLEREKQEEIERKEREIYNKYIHNSLDTGATPYYKYYGGNPSCHTYGCSEIKVTASNNSDVVVIIKRNEIVVRHAYIKAGNSYTFSLSNGTYKPFFYYGRGWYPKKEMKDGTMKGGFLEDEHFGKDDPQRLSNNILEYTLILQRNGNFQTKPSNESEAF